MPISDKGNAEAINNAVYPTALYISFFAVISLFIVFSPFSFKDIIQRIQERQRLINEGVLCHPIRVL